MASSRHLCLLRDAQADLSVALWMSCCSSDTTGDLYRGRSVALCELVAMSVVGWQRRGRGAQRDASRPTMM